MEILGRRKVERLNVEGDGQADLRGHGGEHRAVFVYQIDSYRYWERQLGRKDFVFGQFGENFTVEGLADDEVSIGDRYRIGSALFDSPTRQSILALGLGIEPVWSASAYESTYENSNLGRIFLRVPKTRPSAPF